MHGVPGFGWDVSTFVLSPVSLGRGLTMRRRLESESSELKKDLILRAFWSCLQLERFVQTLHRSEVLERLLIAYGSDILAELDLPPSGISRLEDSMPLPSSITDSSTTEGANEDNPSMWMYYLAQIALRKLLNRAHTSLYKRG